MVTHMYEYRSYVRPVCSHMPILDEANTQQHNIAQVAASELNIGQGRGGNMMTGHDDG